MPAEAFDSLAKFLEERKIEFQKAESHFEVAKESANRYRIIAVVGLFDKGQQFNTEDRNVGGGTVVHLFLTGSNWSLCVCFHTRKALKARRGC